MELKQLEAEKIIYQTTINDTTVEDDKVIK